MSQVEDRRSGQVLERIVYISAACEPPSEQEIAAILTVARARNSAGGVTGLLIGGSNWWLQLLEGDRRALEPIWQSIRCDRRHESVVLVQRRPLRRRAFKGWALRYRNGADERFLPAIEELTNGISDPRLKDQVLRFTRLYLEAGERRRVHRPA